MDKPHNNLVLGRMIQIPVKDPECDSRNYINKGRSSGWSPLIPVVESCSGHPLGQDPYHIQGHADDIALVVQGKFPDTITDIMNEGLKLISEW